LILTTFAFPAKTKIAEDVIQTLQAVNPALGTTFFKITTVNLHVTRDTSIIPVEFARNVRLMIVTFALTLGKLVPSVLKEHS
jgi:hypothetical protein